jgi:hypothetical protein
MKLIAAILLISSSLCAQDTITIQKLQYNGYIKDLQSLNFQNNLSNLTTGNLIHNRFNLKWLPTKNFTGAIELRNRLFWGEEVRLTPGFSSQLQNTNEAFDVTWNWINEKSMVLNSTIDRLWFEYHREKWNIRLGRQRINWGIGTTWNPNDLFNTFNFLDFDYEERPGADAVKLQYFTGLMDHLELAISHSTDSSDLITAIKYFKNIANYDFQLISGLFYKQPTLGAGWSGSIKEAGFKGELQYYFAKGDYREQINIVIEGDYAFEKGLYTSVGIFYNSLGAVKFTSIGEASSFNFSPRNLMPTKWNTMLTISKEINPLFSVSSTMIYSPASNLVLILPMATYSLTEDLDFTLVWQSFLSEQPSGFDDLSHRCFLRFKWSY